MRRLAAGAVAVALLLGVGACGSSDDAGSDDAASSTPGTGAPGTDPLATTTTRVAPTECADAQGLDGAGGAPTDIELPDVAPTDEVEVTVLEAGSGPKATDTSYVTVDYLGIACSTGAAFGSSWEQGAPITAALGDAQPTATAFSVIPGWTDGLVGQHEGALVQLDIPPALAYGAEGSPPVIDSNEPLTFVIRIEKVSEGAP
ncbi:MAG: FKBP-type peptidyl-prolyl cis-trans isomerase [Acidimicrobiales bacterium]|nr:FKBP-type peptidyl-prolyl cis-trans isomerase [Acidimicrobiales bacterium]HRW39704.1 FKBP-type peptidyl-prolyl cis-trans isomerase [Aquihabitans sp.]